MPEFNKIGLIIQGPIVSFGQGPNIVKTGFDSTCILIHNLNVFCPLFKWVVISTWQDEEFEKPNTFNNLTLIKSLPIENDPDNRKKQFITTNAAVSYLLLNHDISHVVKIRTDQQYDEKFPQIIKDLLSNNTKNKLIFSEFIENELFYVGDFIFAGEIKKVDFFLKSFLSFNKNLHPSIGVDYVLKYIKKKYPNLYNKHFNKLIPTLLQIRLFPNLNLHQFWFWLLENEFLFIPRNAAENIMWRGKSFSDLGINHYLYHEDIESIVSNKKIEKYKINKIFIRILSEYKKYYVKKIKYFLNKI
jgi:hypothetical protein